VTRKPAPWLMTSLCGPTAISRGIGARPDLTRPAATALADGNGCAEA
jgi:hypothetical protein